MILREMARDNPLALDFKSFRSVTRIKATITQLTMKIKIIVFIHKLKFIFHLYAYAHL